MGRAGLVGQQHATGVARDEVAAHLGIRDGQEVHALPAVTGNLPLGLAFEVARGRRDAAAEVVVHHHVVRDGDVADGAPHPAGEDALTQRVPHREALDAHVGADGHHTGEDGQLPGAGRVHHELGRDARLVDGGPQADQGHGFLDDHLLVVDPWADHHGRPGPGRLRADRMVGYLAE